MNRKWERLAADHVPRGTIVITLCGGERALRGREGAGVAYGLPCLHGSLNGGESERGGGGVMLPSFRIRYVTSQKRLQSQVSLVPLIV